MHDPDTPNAMQPEMTDAEKWAEADAYISDGYRALRNFYWKAAGRPGGPEEGYLPRHLWRTPA